MTHQNQTSRIRTRLAGCVVAGLLVGLTGCKSTYYNAWEKMGWEKRDILVDRVQDARDDQEKAKEQFKTTLERFQSLTNFQGGELEATYKKLSGDYERCEARAADVSKRIAAVDTVARDTFREWKTELDQYENANLRRASEQKLRDTESRYDQLITAMKRSEEKMQPVLGAFRDQTLMMKHSLNAQAIASLQETAAGIEQDVERLITEMEASIAEADQFISQMKG